jgi:hypothetical protein
MDIDPPWVAYPSCGAMGPIWGGWRQGYGEHWLHETWLPFWRGLASEERAAYLRLHPPPSDEWTEYLQDIWLRSSAPRG